MSNKAGILTVKLRNGRTVLARKSNGGEICIGSMGLCKPDDGLCAVTYMNPQQAQERAMKLGSGWAVAGNRPYYIAMIDAPNESLTLRDGEELGYKTGWYKKPTNYTNR